MKYSMIKSILFSVLIVFLFFVILEVSIRYLIEEKTAGREDKIHYLVGPDTLWCYEPDQRVSQPSKGVEYIINSKGLRGPEFPERKPDGEIRLLTIGDSVTFGHLVSEEETYPHYLQKYLEGSAPDKSLRVINCGVNGYSTREELLFLRKKGINYDPDIVLFGFVLNDASIYARQYRLLTFKEMLSRNRHPGRMERMFRFLSRLHFVRAITNILEEVIIQEDLIDEIREKRNHLNREIMYLDSEEALRGLETTKNELGQISRLLDDHRIEMVFVVFPTKYQLEETIIPDEPQRILEEYCNEDDIRYLDLMPIFLNRDWNNLYIDNVHLSAEGNALVAEEIGRYLDKISIIHN
jgi:lysophospholipase L1-like esterase